VLTPIRGQRFEDEAGGSNPAEEEADVPNGIIPVPEFRSEPSHTNRARPRLAARWRRSHLDRELARGTDPATSPELERRAAELRSLEKRARIANRIVTCVGDARRRMGPFRMETRARHDAIRDNADDLTQLSQRLRDRAPISVRGAAITALLADSRQSPLRRGTGEDLQYAVRAARAALDTHEPVARELATAA
jgi:hypothetical protein